MNEQEYLKESFATGPQANLKVSNVRGSIEVTTWDRDEVEVVAAVADDGDRELLELVIAGDGDSVVAEARAVKSLRRWFDAAFGSKPPSVEFTIRAPSATTITAGGVSCSVALAGFTGPVTIRQISGPVRLNDLAGQLALDTVSGDLEACGLAGELRLKSVSADLRVLDSKITALSAKTVSGDVRVDRLGKGPDSISLHTVSGDVELSVDPSDGFTVALTSVSGRVRTELPTDVIAKRRGHWRATLGGGGREISMHSVSGDLRIASVQGDAATPTGPEGDRPARPERRDILEAVARGQLDVNGAVARLTGRAEPPPGGEESER